MSIFSKLRSLSRQEATLDKMHEFQRQVRHEPNDRGARLLVTRIGTAPKVIELIKEEVPHGRAKFGFHWFTGSVADARRAADLGCYFSINSQMLMTDRGRALVFSLPIDRLPTETDGPFTYQGAVPRQAARRRADREALVNCESSFNRRHRRCRASKSQGTDKLTV